MTNNNLRLVPIRRKLGPFKTSKYEMLIRQFLNSNEQELEVVYDDPRNAYLGLRKWIDKLGLKNRVYVQKDHETIQLRLK